MNHSSYLFALALILFPLPTLAQLTPDAMGTTITPDVLIGVSSQRIDGGTVKGANLFHSFSEFNVNAGIGVYFSNPPDITNIFTRVTGANPSNINGTLGVLGSANLFLMNPNGIVFGVGAKLDVKGSFLGTTATSINFADGSEFTSRGGVTPPLPTPLLSVTVPVGLGFGNNPAAITVQGTGSQFKQQPFGTVLQRDSDLTGLQVNNSTLALIGGNIAMLGGVLKAESGKIELGSVTEGKVGLKTSEQGWAIDYTNAKNGDIQLSQTSLIDASGNPSGSIQLHARNISLSDNSVILIQNQGNQAAGNIKVHASESLELKNSLPVGTLHNLINIQNLGSGETGDIDISTNKLLLEDGGRIATENFSSGEGGNIRVNAANSIELIGNYQTDLFRVSSIGTTSNFGGAKSGNITITTGQLKAINSGGITIATLGGAGGGDITINAFDSIDLIGEQPFTSAGSFISNATFFGGNAGNLTVNTGKLRLQDGGLISTVTFGKGNAGNLVINASKSIEITGVGITDLTDDQKISVQEERGIRAWKLGDNITEAQKLHVTPSGRIVLTATTDKDNLLKPQNLTCQ